MVTRKKKKVTTVPEASVVKFSQGLTINIGNFESVRLDVGIECPVTPGLSADEVMVTAVEFVEENLEIQAKLAMAETTKKPKK